MSADAKDYGKWTPARLLHIAEAREVEWACVTLNALRGVADPEAELYRLRLIEAVVRWHGDADESTPPIEALEREFGVAAALDPELAAKTKWPEHILRAARGAKP